MTDYLVTWQIDIEADSPEAAAAQALLIMQDPESCALHFTVTADDSSTEVNLNDSGEDEESVFYVRPIVASEHELPEWMATTDYFVGKKFATAEEASAFAEFAQADPRVSEVEITTG